MAQSILTLPDAAATEAIGAALALGWKTLECPTALVTLEGELGTGKTTLVRGFLRGLGYSGRVPSPSYTLLEPYEIDDASVVHLDLYRLGNADELELLGYRDLDGIKLVEWAERVPELLAWSDLHLLLRYLEEGRELEVAAHSPLGNRILKAGGIDE